jgi:hypothetical protein
MGVTGGLSKYGDPGWFWSGDPDSSTRRAPEIIRPSKRGWSMESISEESESEERDSIQETTVR